MGVGLARDDQVLAVEEDPVKLSKNFSLAEFSQPARHGLPALPYPEEWIETRLRPLCEVLEAIRAELGGRSITILSGFRSKSYNARIDGARASQHCEGRAADITVRGVVPGRVFDCALALHRLGLAKIGGLACYDGFVHVDVRPGDRLARWEGTRTAKETAG